MILLHNKIPNKILKSFVILKKDERITISFYSYFIIHNIKNFRDNLFRCLFDLQVFGRIYVAKEGINAQISVLKKKINLFKYFICNMHFKLNCIRLNIALDNSRNSFWVLNIKIKSYIIFDGINNINFNFNKLRNYLKAKEVNELFYSKNSIFVDIRNNYEYKIGHFYNALEIKSNTFREQLNVMIKILNYYRSKDIVLYCTGGIRCEKASSLLLFNKFKNIYQIEGGVIKYIRDARKQKLSINFIGKLFVFDERLIESVTLDVISNCHQCRNFCDNYTNCKYNKCHLLFIQCFECSKKYLNCCSLECKKKIQVNNYLN